MKHTGALLLAVMLLASPSRSATGQSSPVRLIVNGQDVSLAASPIVHNGVLMVPVPGIFEPFGSSAVWLPDERAVVISNRTRSVIRLRINDPYALMGTDHPLLPLPARDPPVNAGGVARSRIARFQAKPPITRVVLDLTQPVDVRVADSTTSFDLAIEVRPRGQAVRAPGVPPTPAPSPAGDPGTGAPPVPAPSPTAPSASGEGLKIMQVRVEQGSGVTRVIVEGTVTMQYAVREFVEPDRLVVDLLDAVFIPVKQEIPVNSAVVENVRAAQFQADPDIARVVVTLKRKVAYTIGAEAGGSVLVISVTDAPLRGHSVALDPGHGGKDPGAIGPTGLMEKHVTLDVALRVRRLLVEDGIRVIMTRETDVFIELADRPRIGRERGGTVFVSIHANANAQTTVNGSETYYLSPVSLSLAQMIQDEITRALGLPSRGIKTANFLVLRENAVPTVLVEVAFISHPQEEARLREDAFRERIATAVARGIMRFLAIYPVPAGL